MQILDTDLQIVTHIVEDVRNSILPFTETIGMCLGIAVA